MNKTLVSALCFIVVMFTVVVWSAPVPDTGQTLCYKVAGNVIPCPSPEQPLYGQDANYSINPMSFTKLDGGGSALLDSATSWVMVKDNVTGLTWEMKTNGDGKPDYSNPHDADNQYTWYDSNPATNGGYAGTPGTGENTEYFIKALNDANYGGNNDWRLPTIKELTYIVNYSIPYPGPTIDSGYFPNTASAFYWSSTTYAASTPHAWGVLFYDGGDGDDGNHNDKLIAGYVRAVRGEKSGQSGLLGDLVIGSPDAVDSGLINDATTSTGGYTDKGDGTVTDTSTALIWQQVCSPNTQKWEQALAYCEGLSLGGYADWRLPTFKELRSLVDYSRYSPAINITYFPDAAPALYWSSTTSAHGTGGAWGVYFSYGNDYDDDKANSYYVRAVRGGQSLAHLDISPASRAVTKEAGTTTFNVSNAGTGTMPWTTVVTSGNSWLSISSGGSGIGDGTITCSFTANPSSSDRTGTIRVTATGAEGSPVDVTVTQALSPVPTPTPVSVLSVTPSNQAVSKEAGTTTFSVYNTGTGTMPWTAAVTPGDNWLLISSGAIGTDSGTISCSFTANTSTSARTGTIWVTATGAEGSPMDVTVTQAPTPVPPTLSVTPYNQPVSKDAGTTTFSVSNAGTGNLQWTAAVTSGGTWLAIASGASGTDAGTITCSFTANASSSYRTGTIQVTASGAASSVKDVTVTQAPTPIPPTLLVTPSNQVVSKDAGITKFSVSNAGTGNLQWTAAVTASDSWLAIASGASGTNSGTINCSLTANTSKSVRTGTIRVTASGATGGSKDVTVTQAPTVCTATLDGNLMLHIPVLSYLIPYWGAPSFIAYFVYEYNPTYPALILFKMTNADVITVPTFGCTISTISDDLKIHIPDVMLADGITHLRVDMEYSKALSTDVNTYFVVVKYGVVAN